MRWALLAAVIGCSGSESASWPAPPAIAGARALIMVLEDGDGVSRFAFELDERGALQSPIVLVAVEGETKPALTALYYDYALAELELSNGEIGTVDDCLLAYPMFVAESQGGTWTEASGAISRLLDPARCRSTADCRSFRITSQFLETDSAVRFTIPLGARALLATEDGRFYEVTIDGYSRDESYAGLPFLTGWLDPRGDLWLGGFGGRIARGPIGGPLEEISSSAPDEIVSAFGESPGGRMLMIAFSPPSSTARIYELPARRLLGTIVDDRIDSHLIELAWLEERAIVALGAKVALVIDGDRVIETTPDPVHPTGTVHFDSVLVSHGIAFLGGSGGLLFYSTDLSTWLPADQAPLGTVIQAIHSLGRGVMFVSEDGLVGQWYPHRAACRAEGLVSVETFQISAVGPHYLLSGSSRDNPVNLLYWLEAF